MDFLGEEVFPVLRKEFDAARPAHMPEAPTHASLVARHAAGEDPIPGGGPDSQAARDRAASDRPAKDRAAAEETASRQGAGGTQGPTA